MVRIHPDPPPVRGRRAPRVGGAGGARPTRGAVAQLGEHLLCKQGVVGSIPISSTSHGSVEWGRRASERAEASRWRFASGFLDRASGYIGCSLTIGKK